MDTQYLNATYDTGGMEKPSGPVSPEQLEADGIRWTLCGSGLLGRPMKWSLRSVREAELNRQRDDDLRALAEAARLIRDLIESRPPGECSLPFIDLMTRANEWARKWA